MKPALKTFSHFTERKLPVECGATCHGAARFSENSLPNRMNELDTNTEIKVLLEREKLTYVFVCLFVWYAHCNK